MEEIPPITEVTVEQFNPDCIRKKSNNAASQSTIQLLDSKMGPKTYESNPESFKQISPKLEALLDKIESLDAADQKKYGKKFKHFIFSDVKTSQFGPKLIATALQSRDWTLGYGAPYSLQAKYGAISLKSDSELEKTAYKNMYLLTSVAVFDHSISVKMKKDILARFNARPDNVYGKYARIIVMDSGFKEGIDLFDIKYVHIFEPSVVAADQKQVIGRGTRTCGQKGLEFHPLHGWPLHVFVYDMTIPEKLRFGAKNAASMFDLYMSAMNVDTRLLKFGLELEEVAVLGSVDYELNRKIHNFSTETTDDTIYGGSDEGASTAGSTEGASTAGSTEGASTAGSAEGAPIKGGDGPIQFQGKTFHITFHSGPIEKRVTHKHDHQKTRKYIKQNFSQYAWSDIKMENACVEKKGGGAPSIIDFTPTQDFIRHYFTPNMTNNGMLLWHSVGTGKTCSAIAAATTNFEPAGYTILWVTRTTLKSDIWKNMFGQVCSETIRQRIQSGLDMPSDTKKQMDLLGNSWSIRPMSYKQFSNLVSKKNSLYTDLVKKNGAADPLRKTLLIIDEAHKLYGGGDLSSIERPDMKALHKALMHSYEISGKNSCRLLLMTATPITTNPLELVQLINLCRPYHDQLPVEFEKFQYKFLDSTGSFTKNGKKKFLDEIAGYISYLNREKDARQFSQPILHYVNVPVTANPEQAMAVDRKLIRSGFIDEDNRLKKEIDEQASAIDSTVKEHTADRIKKEILRKVTCGKPAVCKRAITSYMKTVKGPMKTKMDEMKRGIRDLKQKLKQNAATRKAMIGDAADTSLRSKTEYLQTPFGAVRDKCVKIMKKSESLDKQVAEKLAPITAEIEQNTELIVQYDKDYKAKVAELAARKAELLKLSRSTPAAKKAYTEFVKEMPKTRRAWMADLRKKKTGTRRDIRNLISRKKKTARKTRTQIKKDYTARVKSLKKQNASAIKARVAARKNGALVDEIEHEYFKGLVDDGVKAVQSEADAVASAAENRDKK